MKLVSGRASAGKVAFSVPQVREGEEVTAVILDRQPLTLTVEEKEFLLASISSGEVDDGLDAVEALDAIDDES